MVDKYGNQITIGSRVIYADSGSRGLLHRGTIEAEERGQIIIRSERNTTVTRRPNRVVLYTGAW